MQFRLPENLADKLVDYDQTLKVIKKQRKETESIHLKRKTKLTFPCPDIFFDLSFEQAHEIYESFCYLVTAERYKFIYSPDDNETVTHFIAWDKLENNQGEKVEAWYCWRLGNKQCPVKQRHWFSDFSDDEFDEFKATDSLENFRHILNNPFAARYKVDRKRREAFSTFHKTVENFIKVSNPNYQNFVTPIHAYETDLFFYQKYFGAKSEEGFRSATWLADKPLTGLSGAKNNIQVRSLIVNSKFYQAQVKQTAAKLKEKLFDVDTKHHPIVDSPTQFIEGFVHKLNYIYLFLFAYPNEYDRSINLYNTLSNYSFSSHWSTWGVFYEFTSFNLAHQESFMAWFRDRVSPQMFINWIVEEVEIKQERNYDTTIRDTVSMVYKVWRKTLYSTDPMYLKEPKRWRLSETHDHYSGLALQIDNQLKHLPTDLIPSPVEFQTELGTVSMFQPSTNHEVIRWGHAVRNCVGSAGYDDRVLKKTAFLVFAELNGKPWLTSLLSLNMGMLDVGQTVSPFNKTLKSEETEVYYHCLSQALGI